MVWMTVSLKENVNKKKNHKIIQGNIYIIFLSYKHLILDGGGIHDVIGTRCDPFTHSLLSGGTIPAQTCHQNLINALEDFLANSDLEMEKLVERSFKSSSSGSIHKLYHGENT